MKVIERVDYILLDGEADVEPGDLEPWARVEINGDEVTIDSSGQPAITPQQAKRLGKWLLRAAETTRRRCNMRRVLAGKPQR